MANFRWVQRLKKLKRPVWSELAPRPGQDGRLAEVLRSGLFRLGQPVKKSVLLSGSEQLVWLSADY